MLWVLTRQDKNNKRNDRPPVLDLTGIQATRVHGGSMEECPGGPVVLVKGGAGHGDPYLEALTSSTALGEIDETSTIDELALLTRSWRGIVALRNGVEAKCRQQRTGRGSAALAPIWSHYLTDCIDSVFNLRLSARDIALPPVATMPAVVVHHSPPWHRRPRSPHVRRLPPPRVHCADSSRKKASISRRVLGWSRHDPATVRALCSLMSTMRMQSTT